MTERIKLTIVEEHKQLKADLQNRDDEIYRLRDVIIDNKKHNEIVSIKLHKIKEIHLKYYRAEIDIGEFHLQLTAILKND